MEVKLQIIFQSRTKFYLEVEHLDLDRPTVEVRLVMKTITCQQWCKVQWEHNRWLAEIQLSKRMAVRAIEEK